MCTHYPRCPSADATDWWAARNVAEQPGQGWTLLCNGVVVFDDLGALLSEGRVATIPDTPGVRLLAAARTAQGRRAHVPPGKIPQDPVPCPELNAGWRRRSPVTRSRAGAVQPRLNRTQIHASGGANRAASSARRQRLRSGGAANPEKWPRAIAWLCSDRASAQERCASAFPKNCPPA